MKTLKESLFDKGLDQREIKVFGDLYEPYEFRYNYNEFQSVEAGITLQKISELFSLSQLKRISHSYDLKHMTNYESRYKKDYEVLSYIIGAITTMPLNEKLFDKWRSKSAVIKPDLDDTIDYLLFKAGNPRVEDILKVNAFSYSDSDDIKIGFFIKNSTHYVDVWFRRKM